MKNIGNDNGGAAVEFAIILPVLLVLTFGIIEFGFALYDKAVITNASREGARTAILYQSPPLSAGLLDSEVTSTVEEYCGTNLVSLGSRFRPFPTVMVTGDCTANGNSVTVSVSYPYTFLILPNFIRTMFRTHDITATTVMMCEGSTTATGGLP